MDESTDKRIHWTSRSGSGELKLEGFTHREMDQIEGWLKGCYWATVENGRLHVCATRNEVPGPVDDIEMLPFWRKFEDRTATMQTSLFDVDMNIEKAISPHFLIQHLCGYGYTPEKYIENAKILESYGFECMRSKRGTDGKFWEIWFLPGLYAAKGAFEEYLKREQHSSGTGTVKDAINFLCKTVRFGTLDVSVQRAAACINW